jgi:hypothetical protein
MNDLDAGKAAWRLAARPWRQAGAAFLVPGMVLLFFTVFLSHDRNAILQGIAGLLMLVGGVITFVGFAKGDAAKKRLGS